MGKQKNDVELQKIDIELKYFDSEYLEEAAPKTGGIGLRVDGASKKGYHPGERT